MARPGITFTEVAAAATHLLANGKHPTIEQIRLFLGSGSSTTIANHLKQWKEQQESNSLLPTKENLPVELTEILKGLWERVINLSQEKIASVESSFEQANESLRKELEKYKANNRRWQQLFTQWHQVRAKLQADNLDLALKIEILQRSNASLQTKLETQLEQLQERQALIAELRLLNTQAQSNLEHSLESAREQRLLEQQAYILQKDKNDQLEQEKRILMEEKVQLAGLLKQLGQETIA